jgi:hypothetical protein
MVRHALPLCPAVHPLILLRLFFPAVRSTTSSYGSSALQRLANRLVERGMSARAPSLPPSLAPSLPPSLPPSPPLLPGPPCPPLAVCRKLVAGPQKYAEHVVTTVNSLVTALPALFHSPVQQCMSSRAPCSIPRARFLSCITAC